MFVVEKVVHSLMTACSPPVSVFCQYLPLGVLEHFHILLHFQRNFTFVITIYIWQSDHKPWADWSRFEGGKYFSTDRFGRMSSDAHSSNATRSVSGVFLDSPHTIRTVHLLDDVWGLFEPESATGWSYTHGARGAERSFNTRSQLPSVWICDVAAITPRLSLPVNFAHARVGRWTSSFRIDVFNSTMNVINCSPVNKFTHNWWRQNPLRWRRVVQ